MRFLTGPRCIIIWCINFICSFNDGAHHCWCSHLHLAQGLSYPDFLLFCAHIPRDPKIRLPSRLRNKDYGSVRWKPFFFLQGWRRGKVKVARKVRSFKNLCQCQGLSAPTDICPELCIFTKKTPKWPFTNEELWKQVLSNLSLQYDTWNCNMPVNILIKIMDHFSPKLISQQIVTDDSYNLWHNFLAIALSGSLLL